MTSDSRQDIENPILKILIANRIDPDMMVVYDDGTGARKPTGRATALEILEKYIGDALDIIDGTEPGQKD